MPKFNKDELLNQLHSKNSEYSQIENTIKANKIMKDELRKQCNDDVFMVQGSDEDDRCEQAITMIISNSNSNKDMFLFDPDS